MSPLCQSPSGFSVAENFTKNAIQKKYEEHAYILDMKNA
jgi:hypothetical protein